MRRINAGDTDISTAASPSLTSKLHHRVTRTGWPGCSKNRKSNVIEVKDSKWCLNSTSWSAKQLVLKRAVNKAQAHTDCRSYPLFALAAQSASDAAAHRKPHRHMLRKRLAMSSFQLCVSNVAFLLHWEGLLWFLALLTVRCYTLPSAASTKYMKRDASVPISAWSWTLIAIVSTSLRHTKDPCAIKRREGISLRWERFWI